LNTFGTRGEWLKDDMNEFCYGRRWLYKVERIKASCPDVLSQ